MKIHKTNKVKEWNYFEKKWKLEGIIWNEIKVKGLKWNKLKLENLFELWLKLDGAIFNLSKYIIFHVQRTHKA